MLRRNRQQLEEMNRYQIVRKFAIDAYLFNSGQGLFTCVDIFTHWQKLFPKCMLCMLMVIWSWNSVTGWTQGSMFFLYQLSTDFLEMEVLISFAV